MASESKSVEFKNSLKFMKDREVIDYTANEVNNLHSTVCTGLDDVKKWTQEQGNLRGDVCNVKESQIVTNTKLEWVNNNYQKIIYSMLGLIAASLGLKFMGSPWWMILFTYAALFSGVFVLSSVVFEWKNLCLLNRLIRIVFSVFILFSCICRVYVFEAINGTPEWYTPVVDLFFIVLSVLLTLLVWKYNK